MALSKEQIEGACETLLSIDPTASAKALEGVLVAMINIIGKHTGVSIVKKVVGQPDLEVLETKDYQGNVMRAHDDMNELSYFEIHERAKHFMDCADELFTNGENERGASYLMVAERFFLELKQCMILTAM